MNLFIDDKKSRTKLPQVMRAAIHLFVQKGIDGTTIKDIAKAAGVAEGALYRHFKSKDDLAWHLFSTHLNHFTTELMSKVLSRPSTKERIKVFVQESFEAYESDRDLFTYLILREHSELQKYAQNYPHPGNVVIKIIEDGQQAGDIKPGDPFFWGSLFVGGVIRVCVVRMYGTLKEDARSFTQETADAIWEMLRTPATRQEAP
jgi:AcrR family transcriptional regulator